MQTSENAAFEKVAQTLIKKLEQRQIKGFYYENSADCLQSILQTLTPNATIAWGGSESLKECGLMDALQSSDHHLLDRLKAKTPEESREFHAKAIMADYYFMSTNAITLDGELVNIDGMGNRLSCLLYGPKQVFLIVGRNKIVTDIEAGYKRIKNLVAPANAQRLERKTPCAEVGHCCDCFSPDCVCSHTVITRRCSQKGRIHIYFINEELGY